MSRALLYCAAAAPPVLLAALILNYGVDVPYWDQWDLVPLFEASARGSLTAADLFRPFNEYQQFFPNLLFVGLGRLTRWDVRYEMMVTLLLAYLVFFNVARLAKITAGGGGRQSPLLLLASSLLIFSPAQYENWLFGVQVVYLVPAACVTSCLVLASSALDTWARFVGCMCLAAISTFSSANGMLCWALALPALAWAGGGTGRRPAERVGLWAAAWSCGAALCAALYFYDYARPQSSPPLSEALRHPARALVFFLAFLGAPLGTWGPPPVFAAAVGLALLLAFAGAGLYALGRRADPVLRRRVVIWLMLGCYSVLTAALVTVGRLGYGLEKSLSSRYIAYSLYLAVSVLYLAPVILEDAAASGRLAGRAPLLLGRARRLAVAALILVHVPLYAQAIRAVRGEATRRRHAKACLLLINVVPDGCATKLYPELGRLREQAEALDRLGFLRPALVRTDRVHDFAAGGGAGGGSFVSLGPAGPGEYVAAGWAGSADAVLLTYEAADGAEVAFALAGVGAEAEAEEGPAAERAPRPAADRPAALWRKTFSSATLPSRPVRLSAWAFDAATGRARKLGGTHIIL